MNNYILTSVRKDLFIIIAQNPGITLTELCKFSMQRGGSLYRINHHLMGLENEKYIEIIKGGKSKIMSFKVTKSKGQQMLKALSKY